MFLSGEEHPQKIKNIIFDHMRDYSEDVYEYRIREQLDPGLDFATKIVMESDLSDPDILYQYGEYISENEIDTLKFLNKLPQEEITAMAKTYVDGFHEGFIINNIDMSPKRSVNIRYTIGFEPVVREAVRLFAEIGLAPIIYAVAYQFSHEDFIRLVMFHLLQTHSMNMTTDMIRRYSLIIVL